MKFIYRLIIICVFSYSGLLFIYWVYAKGLKKFEAHNRERFTEIFIDSNYHDILFLGSSKMHTGVNPRIIDSICHTSSYNAGIEGSNLFESYYAFKGYLENHKAPEFVFLSLDLVSFGMKRRFFNFNIYLNYTKNKIINKMLNENGHPTFQYKLFPFLILSELDDYTKGNAIKGYAGLSEIPSGDFQYKGFLSNSGRTIIKDTTSSIKPVNTLIIDSLAADLLRDIISTCKTKNIHLVFLYCPEFKFSFQKSYLNCNKVFHFIDSTATVNNITFLRHDSIPICNDPTLFANFGHLNRPGADVYSRILGEEIRKIKDR